MVLVKICIVHKNIDFLGIKNIDYWEYMYNYDNWNIYAENSK